MPVAIPDTSRSWSLRYWAAFSWPGLRGSREPTAASAVMCATSLASSICATTSSIACPGSAGDDVTLALSVGDVDEERAVGGGGEQLERGAAARREGARITRR